MLVAHACEAIRLDMTFFVAISARGSAMFAGVDPVLSAATKAWLSVFVFRVACVVAV